MEGTHPSLSKPRHASRVSQLGSKKTILERLVSGGGHFWADILAPGPETKLALDKTDNCLPVWKNLKAGLLLDNWSKIVSHHLIGVIVDEDKALPVTKPSNTFYSFFVVKYSPPNIYSAGKIFTPVLVFHVHVHHVHHVHVHNVTIWCLTWYWNYH